MPAKKGSQNALRHGGESARLAIQKGEPFTGLAAKTEAEVQADFADDGREAMVLELATRLHTTTRLFWNAIQLVADRAKEGDTDALLRFDGYVKRFGWLASSALRAWAQVREEQERAGQDGDVIDYEQLLEAQRHDSAKD